MLIRFRSRTRNRLTHLPGMVEVVDRYSKGMGFTLTLPLAVFLVSSSEIAVQNLTFTFFLAMDIRVKP